MINYLHIICQPVRWSARNSACPVARVFRMSNHLRAVSQRIPAEVLRLGRRRVDLCLVELGNPARHAP
jgi:hypothetical protein